MKEGVPGEPDPASTLRPPDSEASVAAPSVFICVMGIAGRPPGYRDELCHNRRRPASWHRRKRLSRPSGHSWAHVGLAAHATRFAPSKPTVQPQGPGGI